MPVPKEKLVRGAPRDAIPAITDPAFAPEWGEIDLRARNPLDGRTYEVTVRLSDDDPVIGVERDGRARAYPLSVLNYHEVVNDRFDGPLLVTYCPLCNSGVVAERTVRGERTRFGVSGYLYRNDLVMYDDETDSLWSQILATAIRGPRTGDVLALVPSRMTTWGAWQATHPETSVLLPPPKSGTLEETVSYDYSVSPYAGFRRTDRTGVDGRVGDDGLHPKTEVLGVVAGDRTRAYPRPVVAANDVVLDVLGARPLVVTVGPGDGPGQRGTLVAYERRVEGQTLEFEADGPAHLRGGGSRWERASGRAVAGPHAGRRLRVATDRTPMFLFAWKEFNPDTDVYGVDG